MTDKAIELKNIIQKLESYDSEFISSSERLLKAGNQSLFSLDLFAGAVSNRAISLIKGFVSLAKDENYLSAIPLIRIQLDNGLRFFAATLVKDSEDFFSHYLNGKAIKDYTDIKGKKLSDSYLAKELEKHFSGILKLYRETSGYIHLSDKHLFATTTKKDHQKKMKIEVRIGSYDIFSTESKIDFVNTMLEVSKVVLIVLEQWKFEKERLSKIFEEE